MAPTMVVEQVPVSSLIDGWERHSFETKAATLGPLIAEAYMKLGKTDPSYSTEDEISKDLELMKRILTKFNEETEKHKVDRYISELKRTRWLTRSLEILYDLSDIINSSSCIIQRKEDYKWMIMMDLHKVDRDSLCYSIEKSKAQKRGYEKAVASKGVKVEEEEGSRVYSKWSSDIVHSKIKEYMGLQEKMRCLADETYERDRPHRFVETSPAVHTFAGYKSRIEYICGVLETKLKKKTSSINLGGSSTF